MASPKSANPITLPKSTIEYTAATEDPSLRSQINTVLWRDGHVSKIHDTLLHALHSSPTDWPTLIQAHALSILRSGECHTFPDLISKVLADIRADTAVVRSVSKAGTEKGGKGGGKAKGGGNGKAGAVAEGDVPGRGDGGANLAMPRNVMEEGLRITRDCLECVCEVER